MRKGFASRLLGCRDERGTTLVEFALVFPVLCAILFGIIDAGRFVASKVALGQGAAEAARSACAFGTANRGDVDTALADNTMTLPGANVDWANTECNGVLNGCTVFPRAANDVVFLKAKYDFQAVFFRNLFQRTLTQTSRMVCE